MSESIKDGLKMAPWMVTVVATTLIAIMSLTVRASVRTGRVEANIEANEKDIDELQELKASKEKMDMTYDAVIRLEKKFDDYMHENQGP